MPRSVHFELSRSHAVEVVVASEEEDRSEEVKLLLLPKYDSVFHRERVLFSNVSDIEL